MMMSKQTRETGMEINCCYSLQNAEGGNVPEAIRAPEKQRDFTAHLSASPLRMLCRHQIISLSKFTVN